MTEEKNKPVLNGWVELNVNGYIIKQDATIFKNQSKKGNIYFSGNVGGNKIVLFPYQEKKEPIQETDVILNNGV